VLIINNTDRKLPAGFSVVLKGSLLPAATPLASQERSTRVAQ
jgi:hypothetical protein